ncbi:GDP-mannose 4,6-dehydratase [Flavobacteriaceae bacterium]|nr:GDP-mannose 4,6-dehydratase [Flavobacteriaceae bacterium]
MKTAIITGISGQVGSYLAQLLISNGYKVIGTVRLQTPVPIKNLEYLKISDQVIIERVDLLDRKAVSSIILKYSPDELYNLAAQSSVALSFKEPFNTLIFNTNSVLNLLECIRLLKPDIRFYQASSSEMFGKVNKLPITLETPMNPVSPYGVSKLTAYHLVINYRESFNLFCSNGILFNHESFLRRDNFFIKKVIKDSLLIKSGKLSELNVGDLSVSRDFGYAPMYVDAIWKMLQLDSPKDYIICSGVSIRLVDIVEYIFEKLDISKKLIVTNKNLMRPNEIKNIFGDNTKAKTDLEWDYDISFFEVLNILIDNEINLIK